MKRNNERNFQIDQEISHRRKTISIQG